MKRPASKLPGAPGASLGFADCWSSTGSQPTSSSMPVQTSRSALRMRAIRLGRASMRCGSCKAVVVDVTLSLSPPSSVASDAHSGSQATTLRAACACRRDRGQGGEQKGPEVRRHGAFS